MIAMFCSVSCQQATFRQHNIACKEVTQANKKVQESEKFITDVVGAYGAPVCWTDASIFDKFKFCVQVTENMDVYAGLTYYSDGKIESILAMYEIAIVNRSPKGLEKILNVSLESVKLVQPILQELRYFPAIVMLELGRIDDAYNLTKFWMSNIERRMTEAIIFKEITMKNQDKEENLLQLAGYEFNTKLRVSDVIHLVHLTIIKYKIGQDELAEGCLKIINKHYPGLIWNFLVPMEGKEFTISKERNIRTPTKVNKLQELIACGLENVEDFEDYEPDEGERNFCEESLRKYGPSINYYLDYRPEVKEKFVDFMVKHGYPQTPNNYGWIQNKTQ